MFGYGYAISATVPFTSATTISIFDNATFLGSLASTAWPIPYLRAGSPD